MFVVLVGLIVLGGYDVAHTDMSVFVVCVVGDIGGNVAVVVAGDVDSGVVYDVICVVSWCAC